MKKLIFLTLAALFCCTATSACSKQEQGDPKVESISLEPETLTLDKGKSATLTVKFQPAMEKAPFVYWKTSNESVVTVSKGTVKAFTAGTAVITATCQGKSATCTITVPKSAEGEMLDYMPSKDNTTSALELNGAAEYTDNGLLVNKATNSVKLNRFYALAERKVRYEINAKANSIICFHSSEKDFQSVVDFANKKIFIRSSPTQLSTNVDFLEAEKDYVVEITHQYLRSSIKITDPATGKSAEVYGDQDGCGGCGKGSINPNTFSVGMHWDHYCFKLEAGKGVLIKRIGVYALKPKVKLLIYGDSITQPEGYFMKSNFNRAWTQQIINKLGGNGMSSGRGGGQIGTVLEYIKHELPYIEAEYVMVTIGTNGGNTEANLTELVNYIKSFGAIPILNNVPCNESGTQRDLNPVIEKVRQNCKIKGCKFDLATSLGGDGMEVDKSMMFWEDYTDYPAPMTGWQIYHHPNELGGDAMYQRTLIDIPEIYE